ncbi:GTPase [Nonlabens sp.]|uniref:GTPase n=1 Tax=Nonlabens sp. TaxID=1888209 RepID=UPI003267A2F2
MKSELIFVYNANSGKLNAWLDSAHKIISPKTYECRLCDLTYGIFKENAEWARFRESVTNTYPSIELKFLHIDEFEKEYASKWLPKYEYPCILLKTPETDSGFEIFMSAGEMNKITTTPDLINALESKMKVI